jgi:hypothetical protein
MDRTHLRTDLYQVIKENAPDAIKVGEIKNHFGRKVAIVCTPLHPAYGKGLGAIVSCTDIYC